MAIDQSWLDGLLSGYNQILINGTPLPQRKVLNLIGPIGADDPTLASSDITVSGDVGGAISYPSPPLASTFILAGNIAALQRGSSVVLKLYANLQQGNEALVPVPAGVVAGGPWAVTLTGRFQSDYGIQYPCFGVVVSNGVTAGTSAELFCGVYAQNGVGLILDAWKAIVASDTRPALYGSESTLYFQSPQTYFRILCDGTNLICQYSAMGGINWRTILTETMATVGLGTISYYGVSLGSYSGGSSGAGIVTGLSMAPISQVAISNATGNGTTATFTTTTAHGLDTGASISITTLVTSAGNLNGFYEGIVTVTSPTVFTLSSSSAFVYTSGGLVTRTDI